MVQLQGTFREVVNILRLQIRLRVETIQIVLYNLEELLLPHGDSLQLEIQIPYEVTLRKILLRRDLDGIFYFVESGSVLWFVLNHFRHQFAQLGKCSREVEWQGLMLFETLDRLICLHDGEHGMQ